MSRAPKTSAPKLLTLREAARDYLRVGEPAARAWLLARAKALT